MNQWIKHRAKEPSTWAGIATLFAAVGQWLAGDKSAAIQAVFGLFAIGMREKGEQ